MLNLYDFKFYRVSYTLFDMEIHRGNKLIWNFIKMLEYNLRRTIVKLFETSTCNAVGFQGIIFDTNPILIPKSHIRKHFNEFYIK